MKIKQWEDKNLAQFSYAILSEQENKIILIDPSRDPQPYLDYAEENNATINGIIETHPHADFVSSHLELSTLTGAKVYTGDLVGADYPHTPLADGSTMELGEVKLTSLLTPGHSPDSISILLEVEGKQHTVFSGDTLFIGDCGRPDLREGAGNMKATRHELAKSMYHTLRNKFLPLNDDAMLYPAHGAGTLCGKGLSEAHSSTIGDEKKANWSLQPMTESEFVAKLLSDQPFVPVYFPFDVEVNRRGAAPFKASIDAVKRGSRIDNATDAARLNKEILIIDARKESAFKKEHLPNAINLMEGGKFETWLGSIVKPGEAFYLGAESDDQILQLIKRAAAIGYESQIKEAFVIAFGTTSEPLIDVQDFKKNEDNYTVVDVRNASEVKEGKIFKNSISIPLPELRDRANEIPATKPIVVHCAGGYRSAAGSSIIHAAVGDRVDVFDLGEAIKKFTE